MNIKHNSWGTKEYRCWNQIRQRCVNPNHPAYKDYGGRGIKVCERWLVFENFINDVGLAPSKDHSLDRYPDNNGHYEPGNVRWATRIEQSNNRRGNTVLEFNGEKKTISEWARNIGVDRGLIIDRMSRGWGVEKILTTPKRSRIVFPAN